MLCTVTLFVSLELDLIIKTLPVGSFRGFSVNPLISRSFQCCSYSRISDVWFLTLRCLLTTNFWIACAALQCLRMPQKARRIRDIPSNDCEAAQSGNTRTRGGSGGGRDVFHFVNVNPQSDIQRAENRTLIRSHASKYIWRQHRAGRTDTADRVDPADTRVNSSTSPPTSDSTPSPHLTDVQPSFAPTQNFPAVTLPQQYPIHKSAPLAAPSSRYPIGLESATPDTQYELHPGQASSFVVPPELHTNDPAPAISAPALTSTGSAPTPEASLRTPFIMPISAASALSTMNFPTQGEEDKESSSSEHYKNRVIQKSDVLPASIKVEESLPESRTGLQRLPLKPNSRNREEPIQTRTSRRNDTQGRKQSMISSSPFNQIKNWLGDPLCTIPSTVDEARMNKFLYYCLFYPLHCVRNILTFLQLLLNYGLVCAQVQKTSNGD